MSYHTVYDPHQNPKAEIAGHVLLAIFHACVVCFFAALSFWSLWNTHLFFQPLDEHAFKYFSWFVSAGFNYGQNVTFWYFWMYFSRVHEKQTEIKNVMDAKGSSKDWRLIRGLEKNIAEQSAYAIFAFALFLVSSGVDIGTNIHILQGWDLSGSLFYFSVVLCIAAVYSEEGLHENHGCSLCHYSRYSDPEKRRSWEYDCCSN